MIENMQTTRLEELKTLIFGDKDSPEREECELGLQRFLLCQQIKEARKEKGLTQSELGEKLGVKKAWISKLESGENNVTLDTLLKVLNVLGKTLTIQ